MLQKYLFGSCLGKSFVNLNHVFGEIVNQVGFPAGNRLSDHRS